MPHNLISIVLSFFVLLAFKKTGSTWVYLHGHCSFSPLQSKTLAPVSAAFAFRSLLPQYEGHFNLIVSFQQMRHPDWRHMAKSHYNGRYAMPPPPPQKKRRRRKKKKGKADLTSVLHIRELPHLHMKLAVWFSFPSTNNKNPMIPSWSLVSIYNYSFNPDQIFTKNFEILELEICSKIFTCGMIFFQVNSSLPTSLKICVKPLNLVLCQSRNLS